MRRGAASCTTVAPVLSVTEQAIANMITIADTGPELFPGRPAACLGYRVPMDSDSRSNYPMHFFPKWKGQGNRRSLHYWETSPYFVMQRRRLSKYSLRLDTPKSWGLRK